jgi:hypothetical protein
MQAPADQVGRQLADAATHGASGEGSIRPPAPQGDDELRRINWMCAPQQMAASPPRFALLLAAAVSVHAAPDDLVSSLATHRRSRHRTRPFPREPTQPPLAPPPAAASDDVPVLDTQLPIISAALRACAVIAAVIAAQTLGPSDALPDALCTVSKIFAHRAARDSPMTPCSLVCRCSRRGKERGLATRSRSRRLVRLLCTPPRTRCRSAPLLVGPRVRQ